MRSQATLPERCVGDPDRGAVAASTPNGRAFLLCKIENVVPARYVGAELT